MDKMREAFENLLTEIAPYANHMRDAEGVYVDAFARGAFVIYQHMQAARQDWPSEDEAVRILVRECQFTNQMAKAAYRALLAATPKRQDWQKIESAPRDGTRVLGCSEYGHIHSVKWDNFILEWMITDSGDKYLGDVCYWMPLPPAPKGGNV